LLERVFKRRGVGSIKRLFKGSVLNPFFVKSPRIKRAGGEYFLQARQFDRRKSQKRAGLLKAINSGYNLRNFFEPDKLVENYEKYFFSLMKVTITRALRFKFMTRFNMRAEFNLSLAKLRRRWGFIKRSNRRWLAFYNKFCGRLD
jgi:hypothetical protein